MRKLLDRAELARMHSQVAGQPVDVGTLIRAADTALAAEQLDDAETLLTGALIAEPERADAWHRLGLLAEAFGDVDEAAEAYRRAMELAEDEAVALDLARLLASGGQFEEAGALADWLALESESISIRRRATALARSIEAREVRRAAR